MVTGHCLRHAARKANEYPLAIHPERLVRRRGCGNLAEPVCLSAESRASGRMGTRRPTSEDVYANLSPGSLSHASLEESDFKLLSISPPACDDAVGLFVAVVSFQLRVSARLGKLLGKGPRAQPTIILVRENPGASETALIRIACNAFACRSHVSRTRVTLAARISFYSPANENTEVSQNTRERERERTRA